VSHIKSLWRFDWFHCRPVGLKPSEYLWGKCWIPLLGQPAGSAAQDADLTLRLGIYPRNQHFTFARRVTMPVIQPSTSIRIGIDPGKSGAIAVIQKGHGTTNVTTIPMPETDRDMWEVFENYVDGDVIAVVEKVGGYVAGNPAPGSAMFNFGMNFGKLIMACVGNGLILHEITPQKWQKGLGIPPRNKDKENGTKFKARLRQKAQRLYPKLKITNNTADALLIAHYCLQEF